MLILINGSYTLDWIKVCCLETVYVAIQAKKNLGAVIFLDYVIVGRNLL